MKFLHGFFKGHQHSEEGHKPASGSVAVLDERPIPVKRMSTESTSFVAQRAVDSMLGRRVETGRSLVLIFDDESAARRADKRRGAESRYAEIGPENLMFFSDGMAALEWTFPDRWQDDDVLAFCRVFEGSGVKVCLAGGCSTETQRLILGTFGMKEGMSL